MNLLDFFVCFLPHSDASTKYLLGRTEIDQSKLVQLNVEILKIQENIS